MYVYAVIQVIPGLVVAPLFFAGKIELGVVSQSYSAFNHILGDLSLIVNQFEALSGKARCSAFDNHTSPITHTLALGLCHGHGQLTWCSVWCLSACLVWCCAAFTSGFDRLAQFLYSINAAQMRSLGVRDGKAAESDSLSHLLSASGLETMRAKVERANSATPHSSALSVNDDPPGSPPDTGPLLANSLSSSSTASATSSGAAPVVVPLHETIQTTITPGTSLHLDRVSVYTPDRKRLLVQDLSLRLAPQQRLLIVGNSGTGKSSLLRAMAGLWNSGRGRIVRPSTTEMFFLPQRPYCTLGSLREQLTYPQKPGIHETAASDAELLAILDAVTLGELPRRVGQGSAVLGLDAVLDWSGTLSLGEQQRLAFGRLLYNRPRLAILDEATSALDLDSERKMYSLLQAIPGISYVSVGHRPSLVDFHDSKLTLTTEGFRIENTPSQKVSS